jgi:biopolymer transport protein ExbD
MKIRHTDRGDEKVTLIMTPMIDVVFLLLVFFIMTFKIISPEGDFNIKMPQAAPSEGVPDPSQLPPLKVRLQAGVGGRLTSIHLNQARMRDFDELRGQIIAIVGDDAGPGSIAESTEVELDCDYTLHFKHVIDAITAVSGTVRNGQIIKLIDKIKFSPPRE